MRLAEMRAAHPDVMRQLDPLGPANDEDPTRIQSQGVVDVLLPWRSPTVAVNMATAGPTLADQRVLLERALT